MRVRKLTFTALVVAAGLSLTACNGDDGTAQGDGPAASSASSGSSAGGGSGSGSSDQGAGKDSAGEGSGGQETAAGSGSDAGAGTCRTDELEVTAADATIDGDPEGSVAVTFKNGGGRDCALAGYAGVDLKTDEGELSAERSGQKADSIVLKDGASVSFGITYPLNDTGGSGVGITGLVVTPPDETKSVTLAWPGAATLPVTDGTGTPVRVGPMGSAGQGGAS
jgi:predicted small secreted protein